VAPSTLQPLEASTPVVDRTQRLLAAAASTNDATRRQRLRDEVVLVNLAVARSVAGRYQGRGEPLDDLIQAASVGLVKAVRGYDPFRGHDFLSYAVPVITGEVRRHFRDHAWAVRPPRGVQQLQQEISASAPRLAQQLARTPGPADIAQALGVRGCEVIEALSADGCFTPTSLDVRAAYGDGASLGELLPAADRELAAAQARCVLVPALRALPPRDRRIVALRYYCELSQQQIAADVGISQMQVSRVLRRVLEDLRPRVE